MARPKSLNPKQNISLSIDKVILAKIKKVSNEKKKTLSGFTEEHYRDFLETIEAMKKDPIVYNKETANKLILMNKALEICLETQRDLLNLEIKEEMES